jgi:transcriptional regulator with XRE-family HTH domain
MTEDECRSEFGYRLVHIMIRKGISQVDLAERIGVSNVMINRYINGSNTPSFYVVDKIAKALNCSMDDFRYT